MRNFIYIVAACFLTGCNTLKDITPSKTDAFIISKVKSLGVAAVDTESLRYFHKCKREYKPRYADVILVNRNFAVITSKPVRVWVIAKAYDWQGKSVTQYFNDNVTLPRTVAFYKYTYQYIKNGKVYTEQSSSFFEPKYYTRIKLF
jgi:hypothetical protein